MICDFGECRAVRIMEKLIFHIFVARTRYSCLSSRSVLMSICTVLKSCREVSLNGSEDFELRSRLTTDGDSTDFLEC